ncbi:pyridoxamine 5'-phosphate oxidase family protein [Plantibacter flavus]|uniref:pyridoxamine 5'-phosphate oxidase family protein n=1 Tax=Plantibacter flavus TaxID=150123 RepID=UPI003F174F78
MAGPRDTARPQTDTIDGAEVTNPYWQDTTLIRPVDAEPSAIELLSEETCWALTEACDIGRIAVVNDDGSPEVLPVNFLVHDRHIYIRSAPGSKLMNITSRPLVTFEVDGHDDENWWSVILHGGARRLAIDAEIDESGVLGLDSWNPTEKSNFVRVTPSRLSGRRFPKRSPRPQDEPPALEPNSAAPAQIVRGATDRFRTTIAWGLVVVTVFNVLSAVVGGVAMLLTNGLGMPTSFLAGGPFTGFLVPALILVLVVGGTQTAAAVLLLARREAALVWTAVAGFGLVIWIVVETAMIRGFSWLQLVYFTTGVLQVILVVALLGAVAWLPRRPLSDAFRPNDPRLGASTVRMTS